MLKLFGVHILLDLTRHIYLYFLVQNGNTALGIARRLGYISVVDTLRVVTEEIITTTTVRHTHITSITL